MKSVEENKRILDEFIEKVTIASEDASCEYIEDETLESLMEISQILGGIIVVKDRRNPERARRKKFYADAKTLEKFPYSIEPITSAEICQRLKSLVDESEMKGIEYGFFTRWLIFIGLLEPQPKGVKHYAKGPSEKGKSLGLFTKEIETRYGLKEKVFYPIQAQREIVANLPTLYDFAKILSKIRKEERENVK